MSNQHNSFKRDIDLLSEAYGKVSGNEEYLNENVQDGETAYKGGDVDHD